MTCREFADFMADYLAGELSSEVRALFERHLSRCPTCQTYLKDYETTVRVGKKAFAAEEADVPDTVPEDLVKAILAARRQWPEA